ncbi:MAG: RraA family protein [Firmicutes bacterium]|nr:RraA family protein [Alicyclobacillaceae bacterium]MCL6497358.1 RraA family protein [Bacillota bacterium]
MPSDATPTYRPDQPEGWLQLGTATVYEASKLPCALDPAIRAISEVPVAGPAFTVTCSVGDNLALHHALAEAPPGSVLVVQAGQYLAGYWGEVMTVAAQARGIAGLVIDGGLRDVAALRARRFPAFARGVAVFRTVKYDAGVRGEPVVVGGVLVHTGDWVVADLDGVVVLPEAVRDAVFAQAWERARRESEYFRRLEAGETTLDIYQFGARRS